MRKMLSRLMGLKGLSRRGKTQHSGSRLEPLEPRLLLSANPLLFSPDVPKTIPDQQTVVSTLTVSGQASPLLDVEVEVDITHTWDSDLDVYLISPSGTRVELFTDVGASGDNFTDTILDDQAGVGVASGVAPFPGSYRPEGLLSALAGEDPNGIWQLEITDDAGGDTGMLNHWALRITAAAVQPQSVPYQQVFAAGKPGAAEGWEYYSTAEGRIEVVAGRLRMDDMFGNATSSLNEAILHVNLTGRSNVQLVLDHASLSDENTPLATGFTGHYNGDGIALSVDGVHWVKVTDLTGGFVGQNFGLDAVLQQAQVAAGSTNLSDVRIKFQQFDDYPSPEDGRELDNIRVEAAVTTAPEITVLGNGVSITDGDATPSVGDHTDFGSVAQGGPAIIRTFTVGNGGTAPLTLGPVTVPTGFTLTEGLSAGLAAGLSDTFTVQLDTAISGVKSGEISFATNDPDETPFNFRITGTVNAVAANLALGRPAVASTSYSGFPASNATDGNAGSRWSSQFSDNEWLYVDLGSVYTINRLVLRWEAALGRGYKLQVSNDASTWSDVYSTTTGDGGVDDITLSAPASGRYVRMLGTQRATMYGYSLWEFEVYGAGGAAPEITVLGNGVPITDGDATPSAGDNTDFGSVAQGGPAIIRTFTVGNGGTAPLTLGTVTVPTGFTLTEGLSAGLAPGLSDTFTVQLDTAIPGVKSGDISFATNDPDEAPFNFRITGTVVGVSPEIMVLGNGISIADGDTTPSATDYTDFGTLVQAGPTISRTFTVYNGGTATLTLGAVMVPAGFTLTEGLSGSLAPGASDTFTVRLDNAVVGTKSGDISFSTNDADENPFNFRITGIVGAAAVPEIEITGNGQAIADGDTTPSAADHTDFGSVQVGNTVVHTFTITNSGSEVLHLTGSPTVELVGGGGAFTVIQPVSVWVAAGASTSFQIGYTPTAAGLHSATVRIANDDSNENPYEFVIQGTGTQDQAGWLPSPDVPKALGDVQTIVSTLTVSGLVGPIVDVDVQVDIAHTWDSDLDVYLISPSGTRVELFTDVGASGDNFTDTILDDEAGVGIASGVAPFSGSYRPEGLLSALDGQNPNGTWRLEITDDAGGDTGTLNHWALRITAAAGPEIDVTGNGQAITTGDTTPSAADNTDFGTLVQAGPTISRTFMVHNSGTATLTLGAVTVPAGFTLTEGLSGSLAPGASDTLTVRLDNATVGTKSGDISFSTNDADENPFRFRITGIVAAAAAGEIEVTGNGLPIADGDTTPSAADHTDFGSVPVGNTVFRTFTITNSGSGILRLTGSPTVELVGGGGVFTVIQPVSVWVAAGASTTFQVAYTPAAAGVHSATVRIANDDSNENPYKFAIQGTGTQDQAVWRPSPDVPKAIGDVQTIVSTLTVSGLVGPVADVDVQVDINHTWDSDLDVYLISPNGTRVELFTDVGSSSDNFTGTILDDEAGVGIASGAAPFSGSYRPEGLLSALDGENPNGTWRLEITDDAGGDIGTLNHWALRITAAAVQPQSVPYQQIFAAGKPSGAAGWEYYSTNAGRIDVVAGRLRMYDMLADTTSSLNEAILHVNLTGKSSVQLLLDHWSLSDENTPLATSFTGHYNGDGIALSVDGVHWVKVTDLTGSFIGQSFGLDSVLQQAQVAAGSTNLSDVRIKFQQFDDSPSPDDGREFDNIQILAA